MIFSKHTLPELREQGYTEITSSREADEIARWHNRFANLGAPVIVPRGEVGVFCVKAWIADLVRAWPIDERDDFGRLALQRVVAAGLRHPEPLDFAKMVETVARLGGAAAAEEFIRAQGT